MAKTRRESRWMARLTLRTEKQNQNNPSTTEAAPACETAHTMSHAATQWSIKLPRKDSPSRRAAHHTPSATATHHARARRAGGLGGGCPSPTGGAPPSTDVGPPAAHSTHRRAAAAVLAAGPAARHAPHPHPRLPPCGDDATRTAQAGDRQPVSACHTPATYSGRSPQQCGQAQGRAPRQAMAAVPRSRSQFPQPLANHLRPPKR